MASPNFVLEFKLLQAEAKQGNKMFRKVAAVHDKDMQERLRNVANKVVGKKSAEEVERRCENLVQDLMQIDSGEVAQPNYMANIGSNSI